MIMINECKKQQLQVYRLMFNSSMNDSWIKNGWINEYYDW